MAKELDYRLIKEVWTFRENRIAVRFAYEWHDDSGHWFRSYGNENWEFYAEVLMRLRIASINDLPIASDERKFHCSVRTEHDRQMVAVDCEALDQSDAARIQHTVGLPIARKKSLQSDDVRLVGRTDDNKSAGPGFEEAIPSQNESAHDAFAKLRFLHQQVAQTLRCDDDRLDWFERFGVDEGRPVRELREVSGELV
jgi:hypothetical protein